MKIVLEGVENVFGNRENAVYQHFLLSNNVFKRLLFQCRQKSGLCGKELNELYICRENTEGRRVIYM